MPADDRERLELLRKLEAVLGPEEANNLMAHLPPVTWNEVATKDDLRATRDDLRAEMQHIESALRGEMHQMESTLRGEMHEMGTTLRAEMQVGFATLRTGFVEASNRQIKWLVTFAAAWTSLLVTVVRFIP